MHQTMPGGFGAVKADGPRNQTIERPRRGGPNPLDSAERDLLHGEHT